MASLRSKTLDRILQWVGPFLFGRLRSVAHFRSTFLKFDRSKKIGLPDTLEIVDEEVPPGRWIRWRDAAAGNVSPRRKIILHLHGGAFVMRLPNAVTRLLGLNCSALGCDGYVPWYRLAPEYPFPAAIDDCFAAYDRLLKRYAPEDIVLMGESAGANLVMALLHRIKAENRPPPAGAVALSPPCDFSSIGNTWLHLQGPRDPMYSGLKQIDPVINYLGGAPSALPQASPVYGDYRNFPPLLIIVGELETMRDDAVAVARKAAEARVSILLQVWMGMHHVFPMVEFLPESRLAVAEIRSFVKTIFSGQIPPSRIELVNRSPLFGRLTRRGHDIADRSP